VAPLKIYTDPNLVDHGESLTNQLYPVLNPITPNLMGTANTLTGIKPIKDPSLTSTKSQTLEKRLPVFLLSNIQSFGMSTRKDKLQK